jgi:hypothetical protein
MGSAALGRPEQVAYITVAAASSSTTIPKGSALLLVSTTDCWVEFGNSAVAAAAGAGQSFYVPANKPIALGKPVVSAATNQQNPTHVAAIRVTADGTLSIMGLA